MPAKENKPAAPKKAASKGVAKPAPKKVAAKGAAKVVKPKVHAKSVKPVGKAAPRGKGAPKEVKPKQKGSRFAALFTKKVARNFGIGNNIQPRRDLTRYVKWPRYIRIQRQRRILESRLKIPPAIHQFTRTLEASSASTLFKLLLKYRPETFEQKRARLLKIAEARAKGEVPEILKRPLTVVHGANEVIKAIEGKRAKLVILPHDVDPIELVVAIPTLARKLDIPYVIVKSKARLGVVARRKTTAAIAIVDVTKEDKAELANLVGVARELYNDNPEHRKQWGGGKIGQKSAAVIAKRQRIIAKEQAARIKA